MLFSLLILYWQWKNTVFSSTVKGWSESILPWLSWRLLCVFTLVIVWSLFAQKQAKQTKYIKIQIILSQHFNVACSLRWSDNFLYQRESESRSAASSHCWVPKNNLLKPTGCKMNCGLWHKQAQPAFVDLLLQLGDKKLSCRIDKESFNCEEMNQRWFISPKQFSWLFLYTYSSFFLAYNKLFSIDNQFLMKPWPYI